MFICTWSLKYYACCGKLHVASNLFGILALYTSTLRHNARQSNG